MTFLNSNTHIKATFSLTLLLLVVSTGTYAAGETGNLIQEMQIGFKNSVGKWYGPLQDAARNLLMGLAVISYSWKAMFLVIRQADIQEFLVELLRMVMFTGFFAYLILEAPKLMEYLIAGWVWLAGAATGTQWDVSVWQILERGLYLGDQIFDQGVWYDGSGIIYAFLAVIVIVIYAIIAAFTFFVIAEMYVITAAGIILLGFGSTEWTREYAMRYLTYCMSIGAKMYVMFLVLGAGEGMINEWAVQMVASEDPSGILGLIGVLLILVILIKMIPDAMAGIINGTSIGSGTPNVAGIAAIAAGSAVGAAGMAVGAGQAVSAAKQSATSALGPNASSVKTAAHMAKTLGGAAMRTAGDRATGANPNPGGPSGFTGRMAAHIQQLGINQNAEPPASNSTGGSIGGESNDQ
jgi:type IV secretion system protein TrbL